MPWAHLEDVGHRAGVDGGQQQGPWVLGESQSKTACRFQHANMANAQDSKLSQNCAGVTDSFLRRPRLGNTAIDSGSTSGPAPVPATAAPTWAAGKTCLHRSAGRQGAVCIWNSLFAAQSLLATSSRKQRTYCPQTTFPKPVRKLLRCQVLPGTGQTSLKTQPPDGTQHR